MPKSCSTRGASAPLDADHEERAIYVTEGEIDIAGDKFEAPRLLVFRPGDRITVKATRPSRLMFLGGAALEGPRYLWWNFVSSRKERIEQAKEEWKSGRFALIPGDDKEFIPLPENVNFRWIKVASTRNGSIRHPVRPRLSQGASKGDGPGAAAGILRGPRYARTPQMTVDIECR